MPVCIYAFRQAVGQREHFEIQIGWRRDGLTALGSVAYDIAEEYEILEKRMLRIIRYPASYTRYVGECLEVLIEMAPVDTFYADTVESEIKILVPYLAADFARCDFVHSGCELSFYNVAYGSILKRAKILVADLARGVFLFCRHKFRGRQKTSYSLEFVLWISHKFFSM